MRLRFQTLLLAAAITVSVHAQPVEFRQTEKSPVQIYQSNIGITGHNSKLSSSGTVWPRGSDNQFVFGSGLWLGGQVALSEQESRTLVAVTYNPNSGVGWFQPEHALESYEDGFTTSTIYTSRFNDLNLSIYENSTHRAEEGFPLGLQVEQRLTVFSDGPLKDVAILKSSVKNIHPTRDIFNFIIGTVMDVDIGKTTSGIQAAQMDACGLLSSRADLGIIKFWDANAGVKNPGVLGIAFVDEAVSNAMHSVVIEPFITFEYIESLQRYDALTKNSWTGTTTPGDIIALFGKAPRYLPREATLTSELVLMFGAANTEDNDQAMISIVELLRGTSSVNDDHVKTQARIFPNPAYADYLYVLGDQQYDRLELFDALGRSIKSIANPTSTLDISDLPAGRYHLVLHVSHHVEHQHIVVIR